MWINVKKHPNSINVRQKLYIRTTGPTNKITSHTISIAKCTCITEHLGIKWLGFFSQPNDVPCKKALVNIRCMYKVLSAQVRWSNMLDDFYLFFCSSNESSQKNCLLSAFFSTIEAIILRTEDTVLVKI